MPLLRLLLNYCLIKIASVATATDRVDLIFQNAFEPEEVLPCIINLLLQHLELKSDDKAKMHSSPILFSSTSASFANENQILKILCENVFNLIVIKPPKWRTVQHESHRKSQNYIFVLEQVEELPDQLNGLQTLYTYSTEAKIFLIFKTGELNSSLRKIFEFFIENFFHKIFIITFDPKNKTVDMFSYVLERNEKCEIKELKPQLIDSCDEANKLIKGEDVQENESCWKEVSISARVFEPFVMFNPKSEKMDGVEVRMMDTIMERMGIKVNYKVVTTEFDDILKK